MPENPRNYQSVSNMDRARMTVSGIHFYVYLAGKTNDAHQAIVKKFKDVGQIEVRPPEESDYLLVFCPIASRVGTDISAALDNIPRGKPVILVVMHHTFSADYVVAPSMRQVNNPAVLLTVDCLFYERNLLKCDRNDIALDDIQKILGIPPSRDYIWKSFRRWLRKYRKPVAVSCVLLVGLVIIVSPWNFLRSWLMKYRKPVAASCISLVGLVIIDSPWKFIGRWLMKYRKPVAASCISLVGLVIIVSGTVKYLE